MFSQTVIPEDRTCPTCKMQFPLDAIRGVFCSHKQKCIGIRNRAASAKEVPIIPPHLLPVYHGDGGDDVDLDPEYDTGPELKRLRFLFDDDPEGYQEQHFKDVCLEMDADPEGPIPVPVVAGGTAHFQIFQRKLEARAISSNPLDFRGTRHGQDMENLWDIYTFVREFRLSALAGLLIYMLLYMYIKLLMYLVLTGFINMYTTVGEGLIKLINKCNKDMTEVPLVDKSFRAIKDAMLKMILLDYEYCRFTTTYPRVFFEDTTVATCGFHLNILEVAAEMLLRFELKDVALKPTKNTMIMDREYIAIRQQL